MRDRWLIADKFGGMDAAQHSGCCDFEVSTAITDKIIRGVKMIQECFEQAY